MPTLAEMIANKKNNKIPDSNKDLEDVIVKCKKCGLPFKNEEDLEQHQINDHPKKEKVTYNPKSEIDALKDQLLILNKTLADYRSENANLKSFHEVTKIDNTEINAFINWIYTLNILEYPMEKQVINQIQKWKRTFRIVSVLSLYQHYKESP
jgi:hypothetical protein